MSWKVTTFILIVTLSFTHSLIKPHIKINAGELLGDTRDKYYAFEGIPYADPPTGANRFQPPLAFSSPWTDVREVKELKPKCAQFVANHNGDSQIDGVEDCLYLNVYTPTLNPNAELPVVVQVHGTDKSFNQACDPIHLMTANMVVVNFQYRVGTLGFLNTDGDSGNFGLKDIAMAFRWVTNNIKQFGGNRDNVVASGLSSGGSIAAQLMMTSSSFNGMFAKFVGHTGSAFVPWSIRENSWEKTKLIGEQLGCPSADIVKCIRLKDLKEVLEVADKLNASFGPIIEGKTSRGAIISENPENSLWSGHFEEMAILISLTTATDPDDDMDSIWTKIESHLKSLSDEMTHVEQSQFLENFRSNYSAEESDRLLNIISERKLMAGVKYSQRNSLYAYVFEPNASPRTDDSEYPDDAALICNHFPNSEVNSELSKKLAELYRSFAVYGVAIYDGTRILSIYARRDYIPFLHVTDDFVGMELISKFPRTYGNLDQIYGTVEKKDEL